LPAKRAGAVLQAVQDFATERANYYQRVEGEVVQLSLSIARKILYREAQVDPLLLAGVVRVALEKMEGSTSVSVRVHPRHAAPWRGYFAAHLDPQDLPELVEDATLEENRCVLQSSLGSTQLGFEVQLKEIEQGLSDLMARRPPVSL
jgi:flagellar assembly protein FliH